eukprot:scaffold32046_cov46-Attheya_sp.AAC.4
MMFFVEASVVSAMHVASANGARPNTKAANLSKHQINSKTTTMRVVALLSAMVAGASAFGTFEMIQMLRIKWMEVDDVIYGGCTEVSPVPSPPIDTILYQRWSVRPYDGRTTRRNNESKL